MEYKHLQVHKQAVNALSVIENTDYILSGCADGRLALSHIDGEIINFPKEHSGSINSIDHVDETIFTGGSLDTIIQWDMVKQTKLNRFRTDSISAQNNDVMDIKVYGDILMSCGTNCQLNFHDLKNKQGGKPVWSLKHAEDALMTFDYCPQTNFVCAGSLDGRLYSYDLRRSDVIIDTIENEKIDDVSTSILDVEIYQSYILISLENGKVQLRDLRNMAIVQEIQENRVKHKFTSKLIEDYHSDKKQYLVSGSETGSLNIWSLERKVKSRSPQIFKTLKTSPSSQAEGAILSNIGFTRSSNRLVSSGGDGSIHIWDNVI